MALGHDSEFRLSNRETTMMLLPWRSLCVCVCHSHIGYCVAVSVLGPLKCVSLCLLFSDSTQQWGWFTLGTPQWYTGSPAGFNRLLWASIRSQHQVLQAFLSPLESFPPRNRVTSASGLFREFSVVKNEPDLLHLLSWRATQHLSVVGLWGDLWYFISDYGPVRKVSVMVFVYYQFEAIKATKLDKTTHCWVLLKMFLENKWSQRLLLPPQKETLLNGGKTEKWFILWFHADENTVWGFKLLFLVMNFHNKRITQFEPAE